MRATVYTVNDAGLREIAEFLQENHKAAAGKPYRYFTDSMLNAWAADAEASMEAGNPPMIEIPGRHSVTGNPITYTVSDAGLDAREIEVDE